MLLYKKCTDLFLADISPSHNLFSAVFKPGWCPDTTNLYREECPPPVSDVGSCLIDSDCNGNQKCCSDQCNLICMEAVRPPTAEKGKSEPPVSPGVAKCEFQTILVLFSI